ncbi:MAG: hypothetical protein JXA46_19810 [Dehalococcoidales bacterium]|nr:hypothetical protein [Dehalococcoidales bacterium]
MEEKREKSIQWLLEGPPWIQYLTRTDLLGQPDNAPETVSARQSMLEHPSVKALVRELEIWPGPPLKRHNDANHLLHKLVFLSDIGVKAIDPGIDSIIKRIMEHPSKEGAFQVLTNISPRYGGSGEDQLAWMLCDAPSILYCLAKLGMRDHPAIQSAARHLVTLSTDNGWPCAVAAEFGKFRGPGRKTDPCPYATLVVLKALAQFPEWKESKSCLSGIETLLTLWEHRKELRPFLFAMGTDFAKLKAPLIWYDILHVLDVLTQFSHLKKDKRLLSIVDILRARSDSEGRFTAESVWKAWANWEFGQKKQPSYLVTLLAQRILDRVSSLDVQ